MIIGKILVVIGSVLGIITNFLAFSSFVSNDLSNSIFLSSFIIVFVMFILYVVNLMIVFVAENDMVIGISALISTIVTFVVIPFTVGLIISLLLLAGRFLLVRNRLSF